MWRDVHFLSWFRTIGRSDNTTNILCYSIHTFSCSTDITCTGVKEILPRRRHAREAHTEEHTGYVFFLLISQ